MQKPFEDLIVLDLSRYLLGAYTSLFFADLGAQVIKVEDTKTGDLVRGEMPIVNGESYYHYALNRNKESISLNLKDQEVLDVLPACSSCRCPCQKTIALEYPSD